MIMLEESAVYHVRRYHKLQTFMKHMEETNVPLQQKFSVAKVLLLQIKEQYSSIKDGPETRNLNKSF
jgi:hypothetical protein